jgi:hypothetical protein
MNSAKLLFLFAVLAMLFACGVVEGGYEGSHSNASSSSGIVKLSSSSYSGCAPIDIGLVWQTPSDESFIHGPTDVKLSRFEISKFLITQGQYKTIMGENPSKGATNDELPVDGATWFKAAEFAEKLSEKMCLEPGAIRLPTEAEWEYSAYPSPSTLVIQRNQDYWEWINDCFDNDYPWNPQNLPLVDNPSGPPNCQPNDFKVRKGWMHSFDAREMTDPRETDIFGSLISFRVIWKK